jgi:aarF domain-containing kinase
MLWRLVRRSGAALLGAAGVGALYVASSEERRTALVRGGRIVYYGAPVLFEYTVTLPRAEDAAADDGARAALRSAAHTRGAERLLALALANGGVFVKFAQALSTNSYTLPPEWCAVLARAQDRATPQPWADVARVFEEDCGAAPAAVFASIESAPVAAASLAQVHRAVLRDGRPVAVKIQYPNLRREARADLVAIRFAAALIELAAPAFGYTWLLPDIEASLRAELNFLQEARNGERLAAMLAGDARLHVPAVHRALSSERVLVMEWIDGVRVTDAAGVAALAGAGAAPQRAVAAAMCDAFSSMWFVSGFVHCDPHPGNMLLRAAPAAARAAGGPAWQLVIIDHGMYRRCSGEFRVAFANLFRALLLGDRAAGLAGVRALGLEDGHLEALSLILAFRPLGGARAAALGGRLAAADAERLRAAGKAVAAMDVNRFMQRLPRDLLFVLRSINMIRSTNAALGGSTRARLVAMGEAAVRGAAVPVAARAHAAGAAAAAGDAAAVALDAPSGDPLLAPSQPGLVHAGVFWLKAALGREPVREPVTYLNALAAGLASAAPTDWEVDAAARARARAAAPWLSAAGDALRGLAEGADVWRLRAAIFVNDALFALFFAFFFTPAPEDKRARGRGHG